MENEANFKNIALNDLREMLSDLSKASCHEEGFMIDSHIRGYLTACKGFNVLLEIEVNEIVTYIDSKCDENLKPSYL
mgnify:CR=1 FL=1